MDRLPQARFLAQCRVSVNFDWSQIMKLRLGKPYIDPPEKEIIARQDFGRKVWQCNRQLSSHMPVEMAARRRAARTIQTDFGRMAKQAGLLRGPAIASDRILDFRPSTGVDLRRRSI